MASLVTAEMRAFQNELLAREPGTVDAGIYALKPGFHSTVNENKLYWPGNYSIALPILLQGNPSVARANDWQFPEAQRANPDYARINLYCGRLMQASLARDPRLAGLYEWFGTHNGANIGYGVWKGRPSSSDDTHDWHIHFSWLTPVTQDPKAFAAVLDVLFGKPVTGDRDMPKIIHQKNNEGGWWLTDGLNYSRALRDEAEVRDLALAFGDVILVDSLSHFIGQMPAPPAPPVTPAGDITRAEVIGAFKAGAASLEPK